MAALLDGRVTLPFLFHQQQMPVLFDDADYGGSVNLTYGDVLSRTEFAVQSSSLLHNVDFVIAEVLIDGIRN